MFTVQAQNILLNNKSKGSTAAAPNNTLPRKVKVNLWSSRDGGANKSDSRKEIEMLRKTVMDEVAIPGRFQKYFKPDKRTTRKLEGDVKVERKRGTKKLAAAKTYEDGRKPVFDKDHDESTELSSTGSEALFSTVSEDISPATTSRPGGFENVAWRALEQMYARDVMPHPLLQQRYLDITE
ncbi:hypothetical protein BGZ94_004427, partial [Podila epigama]